MSNVQKLGALFFLLFGVEMKGMSDDFTLSITEKQFIAYVSQRKDFTVVGIPPSISLAQALSISRSSLDWKEDVKPKIMAALQAGAHPDFVFKFKAPRPFPCAGFLSPLSEGLSYDDEELVGWLLKNGANPLAPGGLVYDFGAPLVCNIRSQKIAELFVARGIKLDCHEGQLALNALKRNVFGDVLSYYSKLGHTAFPPNKTSETAFHLLVTETLKYLPDDRSKLCKKMGALFKMRIPHNTKNLWNQTPTRIAQLNAINSLEEYRWKTSLLILKLFAHYELLLIVQRFYTTRGIFFEKKLLFKITDYAEKSTDRHSFDLK